MKSITVFLLLASIYGCLPSLTQVVKAGSSAPLSDGQTLATDVITKSAVATDETQDISNSPILKVGEQASNQKFKSDIEEIHLEPSRLGARKTKNSGWKVLDRVKQGYLEVVGAVKRLGRNLHERLQLLLNRFRNALQRRLTKPVSFQKDTEYFILQFERGRDLKKKIKVLKASLAKLLKGAESRSRAEFEAWSVAYAEIMGLKKFQIQHLKLESEMEHGLNDLQTRAYFSQDSTKRTPYAIQPVVDLQRELQARREKFIEEGYLSRVEHEIKDTPWDLEILWPRGRLTDMSGVNLREWFSFSDTIYKEFQRLTDSDVRQDYVCFKGLVRKLKEMASKANDQTSSKQKMGAIALLACVYELMKEQRNSSLFSFMGIQFVRKMMEDFAQETTSVFRPNFRRIWITVKGEPPKAPPQELDLGFLTKGTLYNDLGSDFKTRLNNFKTVFDRAVKDDRGTKVDNQVKVLQNSLESLKHEPYQRNPSEFKAWAKVYAQIMKDFKTEDGRSQYLRHLKVEAVMEYGLLNLQVVAKSLAPSGEHYLPCMEPLVDLQVRLSKRLQLNGQNGWIRRFKSELGDTPWDMEILYPEDRLLDYLGKERLEQWFQSDPLIHTKFQFLSLPRSEDQFNFFMAAIATLEAMAYRRNPETTVEQKTLAVALLAYAYESSKEPEDGLPLTAQEAEVLKNKQASYTRNRTLDCFKANRQRLKDFPSEIMFARTR
ncbi:hypothetical protein O181_041903 [Austropuccinia psidii MF-1]|uniref:Uncharacterized protein n=1 Tax=Austropuccinia psidii MF-1 TaxID=1389203 RepID=A0A9Q3DIA1_9BASI|nr:hypothetical protein [Austropuccinia psidii MF-1]